MSLDNKNLRFHYAGYRQRNLFHNTFHIQVSYFDTNTETNSENINAISVLLFYIITLTSRGREDAKMNREVIQLAASIVIDEVLYQEEEEELQPKKRKMWSKNWYLKKEKFSNEKLLKELKENEPMDYRNYMRIDEKTFAKLLGTIKQKITKQDTFMRDAISAEARLTITLRYLATGNSFADLKFSTAVSPQSIGQIVIETCEAINQALKDYIKLPKTQTEWLVVAEDFLKKSQFPHCLGSLDGKHIKIKKPPHTGSNYFNYKKTFSIVMMALVNSNSEFLMVDVGANGRISDGGVFKNTKFFKKMEKGEINLPEPQPLLGETPIPYVFVADDAFALHPNIMKPYSHNGLSPQQIFFNNRLSAARVKVENAFGILAARFRIFNTTIALKPEKATRIVLSCCYLHNFIRKEMRSVNNATVPTEDLEPSNLINLEPSLSRNSPVEAKQIRNSLCEAMYANTHLN